MMVKRALSESGCPPHILDELMENCHERRWPRGLSSLETRQNNRRIYDNYVCRRVPGKQAVLVLPSDNHQMSEEVMMEPGLVMIFAHGIEWAINPNYNFTENLATKKRIEGWKILLCDNISYKKHES